MAHKICRAFQPISKQLFTQSKRFKSKINIQRPRPPHYDRARLIEFVKPFFPNPNKGKAMKDVCLKTIKVEKELPEDNPYHAVIAREVHNWFNNSKMVAIFHANSMNSDDKFNVAVPLRKSNMYLKAYGRSIMKLALENTRFEAVLPLFKCNNMIIFGEEANVPKLVKILKKAPQLILMAGILEGRLLSHNEFLRYGKLDLTTTRTSLVQVLQTAAGGNLTRQLTHHQTTLISHLKQIEANNKSDKDSD